MVDQDDGEAEVPPQRGRTFDTVLPIDGALLAATTVASAVAGAFAGAHPTGTPVVDPLYSAVLAAAVTAAAGIAGRATVLWLTAVVTGFSRGYVIFPALASLVLAFLGAFPRRPVRTAGAVAGALAVQVALRLPHLGFHGGSALVAAAAVLPCLLHALTRLPGRARRAAVWSAAGIVILAVVFSAPVAVEAALSHTEASRGTTAAEDALRSVSDGDATSGTAQLRAAQFDFTTVANRVGAWWTGGARLVPVVAQQRKAVLTGAQVARDVTAAAADDAGRIDFARLHFHGSGVDLAQVAALREPLARVDAVLTNGLDRLRIAHSNWLVQPLASRLALVTDKIAKAQRSASLADQAAAVAPSLLGGQGPRHYMVVVMDPSESRGLGGLIVSWGVVTASDGHLALDQFEDISRLNAAVIERGGITLTRPPDFVGRYGQNPARYAQNVTYSPDLPTVTDVMGQLYRKAYNRALDGVLVIDPKAIAALMNISGGVQVAGIGQMTAGNAEQILEKGQYAAYPSPTQQTERRAALNDAMRQVLSRLTSMPLPGPRTMADTLDPVVLSGDLLFWSVHPGDQPFLDRIGMSGAFPDRGQGDLLAVTSSNVAANKIDAYLQKTVSDHVTYNASTGEVTATVQVVLHNGAPATGLSTEVIGSNTGLRLPPGTNSLWLAVYSPLGLTGAEMEGRQLTTEARPELGVQTYSTFLNIPPGATQTVTFRLHGRIEGGGYALSMYNQPTVAPGHTTVTVSEGDNSATWTPTSRSRDFRYFSFSR